MAREESGDAKEKEQRARDRERLIEAAAPIAAEEGWSRATLSRAAEKAGLEEGDASRLFRCGAGEAAAFFFEMGDRAFLSEHDGDKNEDKAGAKAGDKNGDKAPRLHERIGALIMARLQRDAPRKEAARRAFWLLSLPQHAPFGMKALFGASDAIWRASGDHPTDFSYYTKRAILAGVYGQVLLIWFGSRGDDDEYVADFIRRRLDGAMRLGASLRNAPDLSGARAAFFEGLAHLRYGARSPNNSESSNEASAPKG